MKKAGSNPNIAKNGTLPKNFAAPPQPGGANFGTGNQGMYVATPLAAMTAGPVYAIVVHDYVAQQPDELNLKKGSRIQVTKKDPQG